MARPPKNIVATGSRFGSLVVVDGEYGHKSVFRSALCRCDCGRDHEVRISLLIAGQSKSCGCGKGKFDRTSSAKPVRVDLTGSRFGRLVVNGDSGERNQRAIVWSCVCDCGNSAKVKTQLLTRGVTSSCGCFQRDEASKNRILDLSGKMFGKLTVLSLHDKGPGRGVTYARWLCRCDCGNEKIVQSNHLLNGDVASCGCWMDIDLVGRRFGKLVALEQIDFQRGNRIWKCLCDCGGERVTRANDLKSGRVISCGCAAHEKAIYMPLMARLKGSAIGATRRARKVNAGGSFTVEQLQHVYSLQRHLCANCGKKLKLVGDHKISLSRGGSNEIENMEGLCSPCNQRKHAKDPIRWANENGRLL